MKAKAFFKSNAFRSVAVLLVIALFAGALLAIFNDLLFVSAEERLSRTLRKIYGQTVDIENVEILNIQEAHKTNAYGEINLVYLLEDGNYLIQSTGKGGFKDGKVTLWTALDCDGSFEQGTLKWNGIGKVVYESNTNQSYISKTSGMYAEFALHNDEVVSGANFSAVETVGDITNVTTGASHSSAAICNAVNATLSYFREVYLGKKSIYRFEDFIDVAVSSAEVNQTTVNYSLTVKGNAPARQFVFNISVKDGVITAYEIVTNGSTKQSYVDKMPENVKDGSIFFGKNESDLLALVSEHGELTQDSGLLSTGATKSVESCVRAAAFAVCNYEKVLTDGGLTNE